MQACEVEHVDFYFDLMCPYAYQTSKWIREVRARTGLEISWRFFSLEEINRVEGKKHPWEREWSYGWSQMRVGALLRRQSMELLDRWYELMGKAFHEDGIPTQQPAEHARLLGELGQPADTLERAIADASTHDDVRHDHDEVVGTYGAYGVPVLVFPNDRAFFGPVVAPPPRGDDAIRLWELVVGLTEFPDFYELNQPKRVEDKLRIAELFEPYLRARTWKTIQHPAP
ncbi:MAG: hypothetical protein JJLCMIEE_01177 [Acidimicrobiales bacterium]|nr:MAG: hypothetical protein EDR02_16330 [Actinomycetota bacterium]MBV6508117.1 hypothetical protein [Acidimicrobiales bacterium]RIK03890.1 MAG: hypothetical protein DCC48_15235 [Acidobacteriota bacterium]